MLLNRKGRPASSARRQVAGFSLIELMVALAIDLFILAGITAVFLNSERSHDELERANRQIENGRYAIQVLSDDLEMAGYYAELDLANAGLAALAALPDPCATSLSALGAALVLPVQGYYQTSGSLSCIGDVRPNTDVLVLRRASGCISASANCAAIAGAPYFQASACNNASELGSATATDRYRIDSNTAHLDRHRKDCATLAPIHQYLTRIYFIAQNDIAGDGLPTLKRAELGATGFSIVPIAEGIENLHLEYGLDTNGDGIPDVFTANPGAYGGCSGAACVGNWQNAVAVKLNLLARNPSATPGYSDTKTYTLGLNAAGAVFSLGPFNDAYKRHAYQVQVRLVNLAARRQ